MFRFRKLLLTNLVFVSGCCGGGTCYDAFMASANDTTGLATEVETATEGSSETFPDFVETVTTNDPSTTDSPDTESTTTTTSSTSGDTHASSTSEMATMGEPACGNGIVEGDEECDSLSLSESGPCLPNCILNVCGDGFVHQDFEACDLGGQNGQYGVLCSEDCEFGGAYCGDGVLQLDYEDCELGEIHDEFDVNCDTCSWGPYRVVFVTSVVFDGAMHTDSLPDEGKSGLALADLHCQQLADAAELEGSFYAWLSDNNGVQNFSNARDRIDGTNSGASYRMRNGGLVAPSWEALVADGPSKPIVFTEAGITINEIPNRVWTNTGTQGTSLEETDCNGWTASTLVTTGSTGKAGLSATWTNDANFPCQQFLHLYCFQGEES